MDKKKFINNPRFSLGAVFPDEGDPRRPPRWLSRAMIYGLITVFIGIFIYSSVSKLYFVLTIVILSFFFALALDPLIEFLVRNKWNRRIAAGTSVATIVGIMILLFSLFGNLFFEQIVELFSTIPVMYSNLQGWAIAQFGVELPEGMSFITKNIASWGSSIGTQAITTVVAAFSVLIGFVSVVLIVYYITASGPNFRNAIISFFEPDKQKHIFRVWSITQHKVANFLGSRIILAIVCSICTATFMIIMHIPYWLPVSLFVGLVSQFIPTIGTYIGGFLPVVIALSSNGYIAALITLGFLVIYQQVENLLFMPKISAEALELNPAISFVAVLAFGAIFGPIGAFLALPVTATVSAVLIASFRRYDVVNEDEKGDKTDEPIDKSDAIKELVTKPKKKSATKS